MTAQQIHSAIRSLATDGYECGNVNGMIWEAEIGLYGDSSLTAQIGTRRFQIHSGQIASSELEVNRFVEAVSRKLECSPNLRTIINELR